MDNHLINNTDPPVMLLLIQGCKRHDRESQRLLYQHYYGYAMSICVRYSKNTEEAKEVLNNGFLKVFQKIDQYNSETTFKGWLRSIMINTAIDHYRKERKHYNHFSIDDIMLPAEPSGSVIDDLSYTDLINLIQQLSPAYRTVFNLYVIEGYKHEEIAGMLQISAGTSKSNLMKARENLKRMLSKTNRELYAKYV